MTEEEWLAGDGWMAMLKHIEPHATRRKLRLFACACCRAVWHRLHHPATRDAVALAERYADGNATDAERLAALARSDKIIDASIKFGLKVYHALCAVESLIEDEGIGLYGGSGDVAASLAVKPAEPLPHAALIRESFGNPFRPVSFLPTWRTDTAMTLARQMYESRDFSAMPILADALQDAGCDSDEVLNHHRDANAAHVRGCWALDLVLGRS